VSVPRSIEVYSDVAIDRIARAIARAAATNVRRYHEPDEPAIHRRRLKR
jgi:hypothetical protein